MDAEPNSSKNESGAEDEDNETHPQLRKLLPRETGRDIGMGSPVPLSAEAVQIITRLRNMKVRPILVAHWFPFFFVRSRYWESGELRIVCSRERMNTYVCSS